MTPRIEVCAPTLDRHDRLARMLRSVAMQDVPCDTLIGVESAARPLPECVNDLFAASTGDIVLMGADDIELRPGCLAGVAAAFAGHFPDLDGYVGLNMCNHDQEPGLSEHAFFAVGRPFMARFPGAQLFCPEYWHFHADTELGEYARAIGKFHWAENAQIVHHNPTWKADPVDATHLLSRSRQIADQRIRDARRAAGLTWGLSWGRIAQPQEVPA